MLYSGAGYPVTIIGSGFVGTLSAIMLSHQKIPIRVIDKLSLAEQLSKPSDGRAISITLGSKDIFDRMGLWEALAPHAQPLTNVYTVDGGGAAVNINESDLNNSPLGYMVDSKILKDTLLREIHASCNIEYIADQVVSASYVAPFDHAIDINLKTEKPITTSLLIGADGAESTVAKIVNLRRHCWSYDQTAFVRIYQHSTPHEGRAYEKFLPTGPFAILPLPENRSSIVWTVPDEKAEVLKNLTSEAFDQEATAFMQEYSDLTPASPIWRFPIKGVWTPNFTTNRVALLGDAAHVIHPLAGQGFNLGIQDADVLSDVIAQGLSLGLDLGSRALLQNYERQQRRRHLSLLGATDGLNRLFSNENAMLSWIRSTGLKAIESMPTIKTFFAEEGTGLARKTSSLMMQDGSRVLN